MCGIPESELAVWNVWLFETEDTEFLIFMVVL